jgi:hypothetical protein
VSRREQVMEAISGKRPNAGNWVRTRCPLCLAMVGTPDRHGALSANLESGYWHCFRCGSRGWLKDPPDRDAQMAQAAGRPVTAGPPEGYEVLTGCRALSAAPANNYLAYRRRKSRGNPRPEVVEAAQVGVCLSGPYFGRIIVPMLAADGATWLGWIGRAWRDDVDLKYRCSDGLDRGNLYNAAAIGEQTTEPVLVVEGIFDALALWPDAVAVLGKPTPDQLDMLAASPRPVVMALDGDAWEEGWALAHVLKLKGQRAGAIRLPPGQDPDEVDPAWLREEARLCLE